MMSFHHEIRGMNGAERVAGNYSRRLQSPRCEAKFQSTLGYLSRFASGPPRVT